jgi:hypothetical protein
VKVSRITSKEIALLKITFSRINFTSHIDTLFKKLIFNTVTLIDNCADDNEESLEFKPEIKRGLELDKWMIKQNYIDMVRGCYVSHEAMDIPEVKDIYCYSDQYCRGSWNDLALEKKSEDDLRNLYDLIIHANDYCEKSSEEINENLKKIGALGGGENG